MEERVDGVNELQTAGAEFADALAGDLGNHPYAARQERDEDLAAVVAAAGAADVATGGKAVDKFDDAVMLEDQAFGEVADGGINAGGEAANSEQEEILLGLEAGGARLGVAFTNEEADAVTEFREGAIFRGSDAGAHLLSLSRHDILRQRGCEGGVSSFRVRSSRALALHLVRASVLRKAFCVL